MDSSIVTKSTPYHQQVYQILRHEIFTGKIKPGERLVESKIAQEMGVSRSPVREAIRLLEHDGLIVYKDGLLTVFPLSVEAVGELYQCRAAIEPYAAFLATDNLTEEDIDELTVLFESASNLEKKKDSHNTVVINTNFHMLISKACGNTRLLEISERLLVQSHLARNVLFRIHKNPGEYLEEHREIIEAIKVRDPKKAEQLMREHVDHCWEYLQNHLGNSNIFD
ncbi:MAG: GntR family transcriptional regulator [Desulfitobacteriaceae bacterium]|nr:GntR family transcriptional regulator [Desulfitobacteriaceae bacterium]MDD4753805.1 GntR family transcriptional regulator [Desulfitobacteriaceae bacterium]